MSEHNADTQPIRTKNTCRSIIGRLFRGLIVVIVSIGIFGAGFAVGNDPELSATTKAIAISTVDSARTSVSSLLGQAPASTSKVGLTPQKTTANSTSSRPTATAIPPSDTPVPTATAIPPSNTPVPTATKVPPAPTSTTAICYLHSEVWVTGLMNVRERPSVNAAKVYVADAGENYTVLESRQGATYCWLRIEQGWMAQTALVSATKPQQRIPGAAGSDVREALRALNVLVVASENRCSPYDSDSYPYSQSVEPQIVSRMGGRIYGPYTGMTFRDTGETDIEHIVAKSEAHDSGLCSANAQTRRAFAGDLLNLTLASPSINRHQKSGKDFTEWTPAWNKCWFADTVVKVKFKYQLTVDSREKAALERTLLECTSVAMIFASAPRQQVLPAQQQAQPAQQQAQPAQSANNNWQQWDTNGNGRITCKEARAAGIAPVHRGHPAYPRMDDRDNDGVVCE